MRKYRVKLQDEMTVSRYQYVEVEAKSEKEAIAKAVEDVDNAEWLEYDEADYSETTGTVPKKGDWDYDSGDIEAIADLDPHEKSV